MIYNFTVILVLYSEFSGQMIHYRLAQEKTGKSKKKKTHERRMARTGGHPTVSVLNITYIV